MLTQLRMQVEMSTFAIRFASISVTSLLTGDTARAIFAGLQSEEILSPHLRVFHLAIRPIRILTTSHVPQPPEMLSVLYLPSAPRTDTTDLMLAPGDGINRTTTTSMTIGSPMITTEVSLILLSQSL